MRSANNWLAFSLSPHLTIDAPDHAPTSQSNGPKVARHSSAENGMAYNGSASSEFYNPGQSEDDGLPMRSDGSLCIMEALSRSHSGDWAQLKTGHVQRSQHLLNAELSRLAGSRTPSEQQQISQNQYDSINKSDHETVPKLEDFLGGATSLGGQYNTRSDSQSHNFDNLYFRDINVNLSPYSGGAQQQQQQQASHLPPSFHAYGLQRTDNSSSQQPYDSHSRTNTAAATSAEPNLCHPNVHAQNLLQVALEQHRRPVSGAEGGEMLSDCTRQLPEGPNLSALKTWLQQSQAAAPSGGVNAIGSAGGDKQPVGIGKASIPSLANLHQSLSLSMSPGSQSSNTLQVGPQQAVQAETSPETRKRGAGRAGSKEASPRKSIDNFGQRTSVFRGVTRHRWTGRYEAHLWDNSCRKEGQTRKGRQGGYDKEEKAARAYDLAALKYWGANTTINFPLHQYEKEVEEMKNMTRQEYVASLRRKSSGFSRGASVYRGVTRHHQHGRWQARIGRVAGNKDLYLGTYSTQEEAAEAYDIAAIKFRGINAVTNFDISRYDTKRICGTAHNPSTGDTNESSAAAVVANINKLPLPIANPGSNYGQVVSAKELQLVALPDQQQQRSEVSVDQTDEDSQSLQTGNTSQATDGGLSVSRPSHLQEWQILYQQQAQRSWDDTSSVQHQQQHHQQHHHHHHQDARTQSLISMTDSKYQQQQDLRTQTLISMTDSKFQHQQDARTQSLMSMTDSKYPHQQDARTQSLMSMTDSKYQQQQDARTQSLMSMTDSKYQQQQDVRTQSLMSMTDSKYQQQQDARTTSLLSMAESKFQQQQQDQRTQSLMSIADSKFLPSPNMHSAVLRNLMGLSDGGGGHSVGENSGGLMAMHGSGHGASNMIGSNGHGSYGGTQQSPKNNSQLSLRESEDDSSRNSGGGSGYENVLQGDLSRHMMYMSRKQSSPHGSQNSSVTNTGYDSSSLGSSSWMGPQAGLNGRVNLGVGNMPIFAVWNE